MRLRPPSLPHPWLRRPTQSLALASLALAALLSGCAGPQKPVPQVVSRPAPPPASPAQPGQPSAARDSQPLPALPAANSGRGGYYKDDGPGENPPTGLHEVPDAEPKVEPVGKYTMRPYTVFGKTYVPISGDAPFVQRGVGSWYGKKFHGQRTSSGELYDMYQMTAAHPTLPIPSYARVTSIETGKQVVVRVNDRGPFHASRVIDLSYTAALKLGLLGKGSHMVEVERLLPDEIARMAEARRNASPAVTSSFSVATAPAVAQGAAAGMVAGRAGAGAAVAATVRPDGAGVPVGGKQFYLQLGAFSQADNAESERQKLSQNWTNPALPAPEVVRQGALFRLFAGPFANREEATSAAQGLRLNGGGKAMVVMR